MAARDAPTLTPSKRSSQVNWQAKALCQVKAREVQMEHQARCNSLSCIWSDSMVIRDPSRMASSRTSYPEGRHTALRESMEEITTKSRELPIVAANTVA